MDESTPLPNIQEEVPQSMPTYWVVPMPDRVQSDHDKARESALQWLKGRRLAVGMGWFVVLVGMFVAIAGGLIPGTCLHTTSTSTSSYCDTYGSAAVGTGVLVFGGLVFMLGVVVLAYEAGIRRGRLSLVPPDDPDWP